jgi:hypothetical protein
MRGKAPPYDVKPGDPHARGRLSLHQGGVIQTPSGEWWGYSMMDFNSVGRLTALSPVTWQDGWPYFGLPGNLGRTPRTWVKPKTSAPQSVAVPYERDDDFSGAVLKPIWQWSHEPLDDAWSLQERKGYLRLHALAATSLWDARNTLTQRSIGPRSAPSVLLDTSAMVDGDVAGLALFNRPYAWLGVQRVDGKTSLSQFDEQTGRTVTQQLQSPRVWLRAECDFLTEQARFSYSLDGERFVPFGEPFTMVFQLATFQGVRYALFNYNTRGSRGGAADFDTFEVSQPSPRGLMRPIPYGKRIQLSAMGQKYGLAGDAAELVAGVPAAFEVVDMQLGRVALKLGEGFVSVDASGEARLTSKPASEAETFQWIETPTGELVLMSLRSHRFLRIDPQSRRIVADSPGPLPDGADGVRWLWSPATPVAHE